MLNEQRVRQIMREEIFRANNASRFNGVTSVVDHIHNGIDAPKINADDLVNGTANNSVIIMNENEVFALKNVKGVSKLSFYGFAANNADGSAATQRALVTGEVAFGRCLKFTGTSPFIVPEAGGNETAFTQGCNSMYLLNAVDAVRVGTSSDHFVYVTDGTNIVATAKVVDVTLDSISIQVELASNWQISGALLLT